MRTFITKISCKYILLHGILMSILYFPNKIFMGPSAQFFLTLIV